MYSRPWTEHGGDEPEASNKPDNALSFLMPSLLSSNQVHVVKFTYA
jgi:hypothetical protein